MRRIDLTPYMVSAPVYDQATKTVKTVENPFDVKTSLVNILFGQGVNGRELLKRDSIAKKIESGKTTVSLEEEEWRTLQSAFQAWQTFTRHEVELIRRVEEAETFTPTDPGARPNRKRSRG